MGKSFQDQLEDTQNKMRNPSQQQQGRHRRAARAAKEAGEVVPGGGSTPTSATSGDKWGEVPGYDPTQDKDEMARRERNQKWEGDTGDMRLSKFGHGPDSNYPRSSKDNNAFNFQPDKPPQKVGGEVAARGEREDSRRERQERPKQSHEQLFEMHALADQLLGVIHYTEVALDMLDTLRVDDEYEGIKAQFKTRVQKAADGLIQAKTLEEMLQLKLVLRKLALDLTRLPLRYEIALHGEQLAAYNDAFKRVSDFGKEAEVQGAREVAKQMIQDRNELGAATRAGLKVLRSATTLQAGPARLRTENNPIATSERRLETQHDNPPMKKLQSLLNKNDIEGFRTWHREYIDAGGIDTYRTNNTATTIPEDLVRIMKDELLAPLADTIPAMMEKKYPTIEDNNRMTSLRTTYAGVVEALSGNPQEGSLGAALLSDMSAESLREHVALLNNEITAIQEALTAPEAAPHITDEKMALAIGIIEKMLAAGKNDVTPAELANESGGQISEQEAEKIIAELS